MRTTTSDDHLIHGSMDVSAQLRTYHRFMIRVRYLVLAIVVSTSLLIMAFCTSAGWVGGLCVALVELAIGLYFARARKGPSWQADVANLVVTTDLESGQKIGNGARPGDPPNAGKPPQTA